VLFTYCSFISSIILDDRVTMFRRMNVVSPTISQVVTTTIQLKNTSFTTPCLWNWMFTPQFFHITPQHLVLDQFSFHFQILGWSSWPLNEWMWSHEFPNWAKLDTKKGAYLLYQNQVVSNDVYIRVASVKPRKW